MGLVITRNRLFFILLLLLFFIPVAGASTNIPWGFEGYTVDTFTNVSMTRLYEPSPALYVTNIEGDIWWYNGTAPYYTEVTTHYHFSEFDWSDYVTVPEHSQFNLTSLTPRPVDRIWVDSVAIDDFSGFLNISFTQNMTLESESYANDMVYMNISFTPNENVTYGTIEATYSIIDFSVNGYAGTLNVTLDDVNVTANASRVDETVTLVVENLNDSAHWINISVVYNKEPTLIAPADDSVHNYSYPPMTHLINLSSEQVCAYTRFKVWQGNVLKYSTQVAGNETGVYLPSGDYMWSAESYSPEIGTYSSYSTRNFTINDLLSHPVNATGVYGVIYEDLAGMDTAVESALVTVYNTTWSDEMITDTYGYYEFYNLTNSTYYIDVSKDRYDSPTTKYITLTNNNMSLMNIYIERNTGEYYSRHDVEFTVMSFLGAKYENVEVTVYISGSDNIFDVDETDSTGSVVFALEEDTEYKITCINATQGISRTEYLYPIDSHYDVIVFGSSLVPDNRTEDDILFGAYGSTINMTAGYINVTYNDTSGTTTLAEVWLNYTDNGTAVNYNNSTSDVDSWSWVVPGGNASYIVHFRIDNTELSDPLDVTRIISFHDVVKVPLGYDSAWKYQFSACFLIISIAMLGSRYNAERISVIVVLAGWCLVGMGWLTVGMTTSGKITLGLMMLLGTVIAFGQAIKSGEDRI